MPDWRVELDGHADRELVAWLTSLIADLRRMPEGWMVDVRLERAEPPPVVED